jgi:hypothetical protein
MGDRGASGHRTEVKLRRAVVRDGSKPFAPAAAGAVLGGRLRGGRTVRRPVRGPVRGVASPVCRAVSPRRAVRPGGRCRPGGRAADRRSARAVQVTLPGPTYHPLTKRSTTADRPTAGRAGAFLPAGASIGAGRTGIRSAFGVESAGTELGASAHQGPLLGLAMGVLPGYRSRSQRTGFRGGFIPTVTQLIRVAVGGRSASRAPSSGRLP